MRSSCSCELMSFFPPSHTVRIRELEQVGDRFGGFTGPELSATTSVGTTRTTGRPYWCSGSSVTSPRTPLRRHPPIAVDWHTVAMLREPADGRHRIPIHRDAHQSIVLPPRDVRSRPPLSASGSATARAMSIAGCCCGTQRTCAVPGLAGGSAAGSSASRWYGDL